MIGPCEWILPHKTPRILYDMIMLIVPVPLDQHIFEVLSLVFDGQVVYLIVDTELIYLLIDQCFVGQLDFVQFLLLGFK